MAKAGSVKLSGRFPPGTKVALRRAPDGERSLRPGDTEVLDTQTVSDDGTVEFSKGVESGERYFATGYIRGEYLQVRLTGRDKGDESAVLSQPPVGYDRLRHADGTYVDEPPEQHQKTPNIEVGPHLGQHQVPKGVLQRSDTPRGSAHPVDPGELAPYRSQDDVPEGTQQMSSTPGFKDELGRYVNGGRATEIVQSVQRQEDAVGVLQRSDTPHGVATPMQTDPVKAQLHKESAAAKESRGEPGRAAAEPLEQPKKVRGAGEASGGTIPAGAPNDRDVTSGLDAQGQPAYPDVAQTAGLVPAKKPLAAQRGDKPAQDRPDSGPAEDPLAKLADPPQDLEASKTEDASTGAGEKTPTGEVSVTKASRTSKSAGRKAPSKSKSTKAKE
jgi:hypothetical protein